MAYVPTFEQTTTLRTPEGTQTTTVFATPNFSRRTITTRHYPGFGWEYQHQQQQPQFGHDVPIIQPFIVEEPMEPIAVTTDESGAEDQDQDDMQIVDSDGFIADGEDFEPQENSIPDFGEDQAGSSQSMPVAAVVGARKKKGKKKCHRRTLPKEFPTRQSLRSSVRETKKKISSCLKQLDTSSSEDVEPSNSGVRGNFREDDVGGEMGEGNPGSILEADATDMIQRADVMEGIISGEREPNNGSDYESDELLVEQLSGREDGSFRNNFMLEDFIISPAMAEAVASAVVHNIPDPVQSGSSDNAQPNLLLANSPVQEDEYHGSALTAGIERRDSCSNSMLGDSDKENTEIPKGLEISVALNSDSPGFAPALPPLVSVEEIKDLKGDFEELDDRLQEDKDIRENGTTGGLDVFVVEYQELKEAELEKQKGQCEISKAEGVSSSTKQRLGVPEKFDD